MNYLFMLYVRKFVFIFFDDILIYSPSIEMHHQHFCVTNSEIKLIVCQEKQVHFHASQLKERIGTQAMVTTDLPILSPQEN
jgi:hypothetical protein